MRQGDRRKLDRKAAEYEARRWQNIRQKHTEYYTKRRQNIRQKNKHQNIIHYFSFLNHTCAMHPVVIISGIPF
jgi:hypothetical protein